MPLDPEFLAEFRQGRGSVGPITTAPEPESSTGLKAKARERGAVGFLADGSERATA